MKYLLIILFAGCCHPAVEKKATTCEILVAQREYLIHSYASNANDVRVIVNKLANTDSLIKCYCHPGDSIKSTY